MKKLDMENKLEELWKERLRNQQFDLSGSTKPGEGNGYHDRLSSPIPIFIRNNQNEEVQESLNSSIYFRDLGTNIDPRISFDRDIFSSSVQIKNCSENYLQTFFRYASRKKRWNRDVIINLLHDWSRELAYFGQICIEFVSWYDNISNEFYAFELKNISGKLIRTGRLNHVFSQPVVENNEIVGYKKLKIPKSKCILIDWPKELGGISGYMRKRKKISKLGNKFDIQSTLNSPGTNIKNWTSYDMKFSSILSDWGLTHPPEELSYFYKQFTRFKIKRTTILCTRQLLSGIDQVLQKLNHELGENAVLEFSNSSYDLDKFDQMFQKWKSGQLSFRESSDYLHK